MVNDMFLDLNKSSKTAACSILVATYNRPAFLELLLMGLSVQTVKRFEVVVCDDGSTPETLDMVEAIAPNLHFGLRYVWHEDKGFRKARILNKGIIASCSDYLIFIDDDCVPHKRFIEGHLKRRKQNSLVFGKLVRIDPTLSSTISPEMIVRGDLHNSPFFTASKKLKLISAWIRFYRHLFQNKPLRPKLYGAKFAVDKASLYRVNGFNEGFEGWDYEDNELRMRLVNNDIRMKEAILCAIVFHLDTIRDGRYTTGKSNKDLFLQTKNASWAESGLTNHS